MVTKTFGIIPDVPRHSSLASGHWERPQTVLHAVIPAQAGVDAVDSGYGQTISFSTDH
jgi:hypothetical protein